ncbi:alpha/beta hydrolase [Mameliella sp. AT18]|nr:alpha/beta hydrolase [Mameliella sp. AT18]
MTRAEPDDARLLHGQPVHANAVKLAESAGITLATQSFGRPSDPAILLVMGATTSMLGWPDEFCADLAKREFFVIRFDHRDTGESTTVPPGQAAYSVEDMAGDVIAVMDAYSLVRAHLAGMSLGGMISQMVALLDPERLASLTLLASEPLGWDGPPLPHLEPAFLEHFASLGALDWSDRDAVIRFLLRSEELCAGSAHALDVQRHRSRIEAVLARTTSPASMFNHGAVTAREDWIGRFREIACPVLVLHGQDDPILPIENGKALAAGITGAELIVIPGLGHELPLPVLPLIANRMATHVQRSER